MKLVPAFFGIALVEIDQRNNLNVKLAGRPEPLATHGPTSD
jgi:hypothetical protein